MIYQNLHLEQKELVAMNRRQFLKGSAVVVGTLFGVGNFISFPSEAEATPVLEIARQFAVAIGANVVSDYITDHLRKKRSASSVVRDVRHVNNKMAENGFNVIEPKIYVFNTDTSFFYPAMRKSERYNICIPFMDATPSKHKLTNTQHCITMLEGPSIFGLAGVAKILGKNHSKEYVKKVLLPRKGIRRSDATFQRSSQPDVYDTDVGRVFIGHKPQSETKGEVVVSARKRIGRGWKPLIDEAFEYELA